MLSSDAPCPKCGHLLWFSPNGLVVVRDISAEDIESLLQVDADRLSIRLLLNFEGVAFMQSSMIAKLVRLNRAMKECGGRLVFCNVSVNLMEVFKITRVNRLFEIAGDEGQGLDALK